MHEIKHQNQIFPVIIEAEEDGGFVVTNPSIDGCYSQGETIEEALANIREATELCLEELRANKHELKIKDVSLHLINLKKTYA